MRVSLGGGRCIYWRGRPEIAETRRRDHPIFVADEIGRKSKALVVTSSRSMDRKESWATSTLSILNWTGHGAYGLAAKVNDAACVANLLVIRKEYRTT